MKKSLLLIISVFLFSTVYSSAQTKYITLVAAVDGATSMHSSLQSANDAAVDGDFIYIPEGSFSGANIDKKLNIYGVGCGLGNEPYTRITSDINFRDGSEYSYVSGIWIDATAGVPNSSSYHLNNLTFERCRIKYFKGYYSSNSGWKAYRMYCLECVIENVVYKLRNSQFDKCVIKYINKCENCNFNNCIIIANTTTNSIGEESVYNTFLNTIFFNSDSAHVMSADSKYNSFSHCAFSCDFTFPANTNIGNDILTGLVPTDMCEDLTSTYSYSTTNDYHIKTTSSAHNTGADGTDLGIYGTANPFKEDMKPAIPQVSNFMVYYNEATGKWEIRADVKAEQK